MTGPVTRRTFGRLGGAVVATLASPNYLRAQGKAKVVIIGGGPGGATAARYIAKDSGGDIDVTLIEAEKTYVTCIFSNLYLAGLRSFASITQTYDRLATDYGITVVTGRAMAIDRSARTVAMTDGTAIPYDRLVVSPGIDFIWDSIPGYSETASQIMPHAWKAGPQTQLLKAKLDALEDGQQIVLVPPPDPVRCPPAPYERASMMAHVLKAKGFKNTVITILDPKTHFSKQPLFTEGWESHYPGMIEWYGPDVHGGILNVDPASGEVETDFDTFTGDLVNVIPAHKAGLIATGAGLTDDGGFCPIEAQSMRSKLDQNIFVVGDAAIAGAMPKSGFAANSQAKVAAMAVRADLTGFQMPPAKYANTCWSLIEANDGVKVGAGYSARDGKIVADSNFVSGLGEDAALRRTTFEESVNWYDAVTADIFG